MSDADRRHTRMREMLAQQGERGASSRQLAGWLSGEGLNTPLDRVQGWLAQDMNTGLTRMVAPLHWVWTGPQP